MNVRTKNIGGLSCIEVDSLLVGDKVRLVAVFCHGFGGSGADFIPLAREILSSEPKLSRSVRFVFPDAPILERIDNSASGRAWWKEDVKRLAMAVRRGELRNQTEEQSNEMVESRGRINATIDDLRLYTELPMNRFVLGGFSQGAVLATDVALRLRETPVGLCVMSGTLVCESTWKNAASNCGEMRVLQSHGIVDQILPFVGAVWMRDMLVDAGLNVDFVEFEEGHAIPVEITPKLAKMFLRCVV